MKKFIYLVFGLCVTYHSNTFGKDDKNTLDNSDKPITEPLVIPEPAKKVDDIVVNMEMINSFRRCYDRIEVIPWGELIRTTNPKEWGIAYMAYRRLTFKAPADSGTLMTLLAAEMTKVREDLGVSPDSVSIDNIAKAKKIPGPGKIIIIKKEEIANN